MQNCSPSLSPIMRLQRTAKVLVATLPALCIVMLGVGMALAQQPTTAQRNAIKAACRSDFMAQCSGVTPGGKEALSCLQQHNASLSSACQSAIGALSAGAKPAAAPAAQPTTPSAPATSGQPTQAQRNAIKAACRSDFMAQCSGVTPGGAQALTCLQQHNASLSASCQAAVGAIGGGSAAAPAATAAPAAAAPAAQPMPSFTPRQEIFIMRQSCGMDFRTYCGTVPLGGGRGIACLRNNISRLSPACQRVLTSGL